MRLQYRSPLDLPRIPAGELETAPGASVCVEPPGTNRRFTRYAPAFIDDPAGTGLFEGLGLQDYASPPVFISALPKAMLFGYRAMAVDDNFYTDEAWTDLGLRQRFTDGLASADSFPNEDTGLLGSVGDTTFDLPIEGRPRRHFDQTAVVLCSHEPSNYGSFLFRVLPKLYAVRQHGLDGLPVVVWAHTPSFAGLLALAGVPEIRVIQHDTHCLTTFDRLLAPSLRNPHGFLDAESRALLRQLACDVPASGLGRRLYISRMGQTRRNASTRQMTNEPEVVEMVQRLGFEVVEPETLSPAEQVSAFANADIILGPAGSALFNIVFCRPGTKVIDIESEPHWIYAHAGLFSSCQTDYGIFVGKVDVTDASAVHRRFSVDIPALEARLLALTGK